jgi:hypothetical protein
MVMRDITDVIQIAGGAVMMFLDAVMAVAKTIRPGPKRPAE